MPYEPISNFISKAQSNLDEITPDKSIEEAVELPIPKDFDSWNVVKKEIQDDEREIIFNERDIWWCSLGLNIGQEQDGKNENFERPVLILRKFNSSVCLCVPLTSSEKENPFHRPIPSFGTDSSVVISQIKLISTKRLLRKMGESGRKDFRRIKDAIHKILR